MSNAGQPGVRFGAGQFSSCAELEGKSCLMLSRIQGFFPLKKSPREGRFGVEQWQILGSLPCSEEPRALLWVISPTAAQDFTSAEPTLGAEGRNPDGKPLRFGGFVSPLSSTGSSLGSVLSKQPFGQ